MTEPESNRPPRRPRYRGTHPRSFSEKYKEHQPSQYPDDVAHVLAAGRTPAGTHRPILVSEILSVLAPHPGEVVIDCTLGYGGHACELLKAIQPGGRLLGIDVDPLELPKAESRLRELGFPPETVTVRRSNFAGLGKVVAEQFPDGADVILADLGVSSMQLDDPARGFTFKVDAPLDMRMNPGHGQSAAALLAKVTQDQLSAILSENADEPRSQRLARAIVESQSRRPIATTCALAELVRMTVENAGCSIDDSNATVRRVFQALRIAVNDEFGALDALLRQLPGCLKPGGRVAILTFHSGEDRRVKHAFKSGMAAGIYVPSDIELIRPSPQEQHDNPRSASAKLRHATRM